MLAFLATLRFDPGLPDPKIPADHWAILRSPWFWSSIGLVFLGVFFIRLFLLKQIAPPLASPFNRSAALAALAELEEKNLNPRDTAAAVWNITRRYLAHAHKIPTLHRTTYELFQQIRNSSDVLNSRLTPRLLAKFEPLSQACEVCEFGVSPLSERKAALIQTASDLITQDLRHVEPTAS